MVGWYCPPSSGGGGGISDPGGSDGDILVKQAGVWTNRTPAQARVDLGVLRWNKVRPKVSGAYQPSWPGVNFNGGRDTTLLANILFYQTKFTPDEDILPTHFVFRVPTTPGAAVNARCAIVEVNNDQEPSAAALFDIQVVVGTISGLYTTAISGVTLQAGKTYIPLMQCDANMPVRSWYATTAHTEATLSTSSINQLRLSRSYAALSGTPPAPGTISNANGLVGGDTFFWIRW